jgi:hypothetical protein
MSHKKRGLQTFGLTLIAVLGLTAFMAVGAQANWLVLEGGIAVELPANETVEVTAHQLPILLVPEETKLEIDCKTIAGVGLKLIGKSAKAEGKVALNQCTTKQEGKAAEGCNPLNQPIVLGGTATVILHTDGKNYILFAPNAGLPFTELEFNPATCSLPQFDEIKGNLVAECGLLKEEEVKNAKGEFELKTTGEFVSNDCNKHMQWHLLQLAPAALFPSDVFKFGKKIMRLDGIVKVELSGTRKGLLWSGEI